MTSADLPCLTTHALPPVSPDTQKVSPAPSAPRSAFLSAAIIAIAASLAACADEPPSCSDPDVLETVQNIVRNSEKSSMAVFYYDLDKSTFTLDDIITVSRGSQRSTCKAQLVPHLVLTNGLENDKAARAMLGTAPRTEIVYTLELTDDHKKVHVTVHKDQ